MWHWYFFFSWFILWIFRCAVSNCFNLKLSVQISHENFRSWFSLHLFLCAVRWCRKRKLALQISQMKRLSWLCTRTCTFNVSFSVHSNSHILHLNLRLEHAFSCVCLVTSSENRSVQNEQWNGNSDRCRFKCRFKSPFWVKDLLQYSHENFFIPEWNL